MLVLEMFTAEAVPNDALDELVGAVQKLPKSYQRFLAPAIAFQASTIGVSASSLLPAEITGRYVEEVLRFGELLIRDRTVIGIAAKEQMRGRIARRQDGSVERRTPGTMDIMLFALAPAPSSKALADVAKRISASTGVTLTRYAYESHRFKELLAEGMVPPSPPTKEQRKAAHLLADRDIRSLAVAIKASGGLILSEIPKQLTAVATPENAAALQDIGLVGTEVVVICTRTMGQVARAESRAQIEKSVQAGVKCACGRPLSEEKIEEALTITSLGREMIDGSKWMSSLLLDNLIDMGIPVDRILIEQQVAGDEMDCFADISGELAFFELKDKEFSLGNAYSFGAKMSVYRPEAPVVVTTEHVGNDAKEHFQRARLAERQRPARFDDEMARAEVRYIEGLDGLRSSLEELASQIYRRDGIRLMREVLSRAAIEPSSLLDALAAK